VLNGSILIVKEISMGKLLKIILGLVALLVAIIVIAAVVLPMVVDPNDYKDEIAATVEKQTGRTLSIEGDITLSVFPWLGLDIGPTQLSNAAGFDAPYMARMEAVQVRVKLLPLLRKQLEVDTLRLSGLRLNLGKDPQGQTNWADITAHLEKEGEEAPQPDEATDRTGDGSGAQALDRLAIGGIEVSDAQLHWDDRSTDSRYDINELSFTTGAIEPGEAFDLDLHFQMAATQPPVNGHIELGGDILVATGLDAVTITAATFGLDLKGEGVPGGDLSAAMRTDVKLDMAAQTLSLSGMTLETEGLNITGHVDGTAISGEDPQFKGVLTLAPFVPRELLQALGQEQPQTADSAVLGKADATMTWDASLQHFAATALTLHLDDSTLEGNARVDGFEAPAITFTAELDQFDLDRYLPPAAEEDAGSKNGEKQAAETAAAGSDELPLETLRGLNLNGRLGVGRLHAFNLDSRDIEIQVKARDGVLKISPLGANLYNGSVQADVTLDARKDTPRFSVNETLTGVQAGPLLKDLTGKEQLLGTANVKANLSGTGLSPEKMRQTLNGTAGFEFTDGAVKGVNIAALIRSARAKIKGEPAPEQTESNQTDFALMKGTATVTSGEVKNDDLLLKSPLLRITGAGNVSLPKETIDYTLTTKFVGSLKGQGGEEMGELRGVSIPVHVGGTFSKPTYAPDLAAALSDAAKAEVEKKVEEEKQKLQKKLGDELSDKLLKDLFK
jgi:AsmA protein